MMKFKRHDAVFWGALVVVLVVAGYFRLTNVEANPGWFTDEGTHLEVARNILDGRTQYLAVQDSVLLFSRVPLFGYLLAGVGGVFGLNMTTLRLLTGSLGVVSVGLLGLFVWRMSGERLLAITAAFVLAIFPAAIVFSRFGFSYNLLAPLLLLACLGLWEYRRGGSNRWLVLAALAIGLGTLSDLWAISCLPVLAFVVLGRAKPGIRDRFDLSGYNWGGLAWSLSLALLPIGGYIVYSLLIRPDAFLFDLQFVQSRLSLSPGAQIQSLATNVTVLVSQDGWLALGAAGLFIMPKKSQSRFLLLFFVVPFAILGRSTALHNLGFHYFIPFLPFIALGLAALLYRAFQSGAQIGSRPVAVIGVAIPLLTTLLLLNSQLNGRFQSAIDPFLANPRDAKAVAEFINQTLDEDDLVIANATITWILETKRADFQMSIAANGITTPHLPGDIPGERFAFDPDFRQAEMVVIDNWWYGWGQFNVPGLSEMIEVVTDWPVVFSAGDMVVYRNPRDGG